MFKISKSGLTDTWIHFFGIFLRQKLSTKKNTAFRFLHQNRKTAQNLPKNRFSNRILCFGVKISVFSFFLEISARRSKNWLRHLSWHMLTRLHVFCFHRLRKLLFNSTNKHLCWFRGITASRNVLNFTNTARHGTTRRRTHETRLFQHEFEHLFSLLGRPL